MTMEAIEAIEVGADPAVRPGTTASSPGSSRALGARQPEGASADKVVATAAGADGGRRAVDEGAVARDRRDWSGTKPGAFDYLRPAQARSGRGPLELAREWMRLQREPGRLTWPEYVQYGVYNTSRYDAAAQARFISNTLHWPITHVCCDMTWQAATEDKWLCARILDGSRVPTAGTLAVADRSERLYPQTEKITSAGQLRDFMTRRAVLPVFGKENRGICSFGAFLVTEADRDGMVLKGHGRLGYDDCMDRFIGETPYLLQTAERNHGFFQRYTESLATVRVCILAREDGIQIPFAVLKLPSRDNIADSFWRPGNLACAVDVPTGRIVTARTKDAFGTTDHEAHPETGETLIGEVVPMWPRLLDLARTCAPIFAPVRYQSMDIAVTEDGPVVVEVNTGGGFDLPQLASGEGFLTAEVREFFRACGYRKL